MAAINDMDCEPQVAHHPQTTPSDLQPQVPSQEEARGRKEKRRHVLIDSFSDFLGNSGKPRGKWNAETGVGAPVGRPGVAHWVSAAALLAGPSVGMWGGCGDLAVTNWNQQFPLLVVFSPTNQTNHSVVTLRDS